MNQEGETTEGHLHPLTHIMNRSAEIFTSLGFEIASSPEVETEEYNFDKLNVPKDHPARDLWDTFWLKNSKLLRTHCTPSDVHYMQSHGAPARIITMGKTYRYEATDATHETEFFQIDGLCIGENITLAHLRGTLEKYFTALFGKVSHVRMRPSFFPFVEPGVEIDVSCFKCEGKGCSICKQSGWIEIMGAGMVHPFVLQSAGVDPRKNQGWAFGGGIDRIAMLTYGIDDVRLSHTGDLRFINQF